jgi:hypothetical protein
VEDLDDVEDGKVAAGARPRGARVRDWPDWLVGFPRVEEFEETLRRAGAHKVDVAHGDLDGRPVVRVMGEW